MISGKCIYVHSNGASESAPYWPQRSYIPIYSSTITVLVHFHLEISGRIIIMHVFSHCFSCHQQYCIHYRWRLAQAINFFVLLCFSSVCLCLYNACDNPTLLADTLPGRLSYGDIWNHCKQITLAQYTWKIYVLGGGSCMTIRNFERWGMLPVW